jgi:nucleoside-diphosphate-sugar epimerase
MCLDLDATRPIEDGQMNTMLVVGATGVIGESALERFATAPGWRAVAVSRRNPEVAGDWRHVALDLQDPAACEAACRELRDVTHVVYAAVSEQPGLVAGWRDTRQMDVNLAMLRNLIEPLSRAAPGLRHVALLQGAKAYGSHAGHTAPIPAREDAPRVEHENFYWLQEDYVRETAQACGFGWTVFRPQVLIGAAWGVVMNPLLALGAYAAIRREEGLPFSYFGGPLKIGELVDPDLLAAAFEWAAEAPAARGQAFNLTNGDVFAWREAWPVLADAFGVKPGPDEPLRVAEYLAARGELWDRIVAREGLRPLGLMRFLGESHNYADILLSSRVTLERPVLLSTVKIRQAGFAECRDSHASLRHWIGQLQARRLIPGR